MRVSEGGDSWADAIDDEIVEATADFSSNANTALPAALIFIDSVLFA